MGSIRSKDLDRYPRVGIFLLRHHCSHYLLRDFDILRNSFFMGFSLQSPRIVVDYRVRNTTSKTGDLPLFLYIMPLISNILDAVWCTKLENQPLKWYFFNYYISMLITSYYPPILFTSLNDVSDPISMGRFLNQSLLELPGFSSLNKSIEVLFVSLRVSERT